MYFTYKKDKILLNNTGRPRIWYQVLPVFFFSFDGSTWYQMQLKKIWKIFWKLEELGFFKF
jgi:hypothetical protein